MSNLMPLLCPRRSRPKGAACKRPRVPTRRPGVVSPLAGCVYVTPLKIIRASGNKKEAATVSLASETLLSRCSPLFTSNSIQGERQC